MRYENVIRIRPHQSKASILCWENEYARAFCIALCFCKQFLAEYARSTLRWIGKRFSAIFEVKAFKEGAFRHKMTKKITEELGSFLQILILSRRYYERLFDLNAPIDVLCARFRTLMPWTISTRIILLFGIKNSIILVLQIIWKKNWFSTIY